MERLALPSPIALIALVVACALTPACAQTPATTGTVTGSPTIDVASQPIEAPEVVGPILGTVEVWLKESGVMLWQPRADTEGAYRFEVTNRGRFAHDLTVVRWGGSPQSLPSRSGRALLQGVEVLGQTPPIAPGETATLDANLNAAGGYLLLSSRETDFGDGMVAPFRVGSGPALPAPVATPGINQDDVLRVYAMDSTLIGHTDVVDDGLVMIQAQNLGPSAHDLVLLRWRGDPHSLPVDDAGELMLDALIVIARFPALAAGDDITVDLELEGDMGYVLVSTSPGDYQAGMAFQFFTR